MLPQPSPLWVKSSKGNNFTHLAEIFCELTGGKSSSRLNLTGVDVTCNTLLLSLPSDEFPECWLATGESFIFGDSLTFFDCTLSIGLMVTLPPFPDGGVENKLPLALLFVESLLVSDVGVRCLGSLRFFLIFLGEMTGRSNVKWHEDSPRM